MSEKINQLIIQVKQHLNLGQKQSQKSIQQIQNQIDDKNRQIRDIFARNLSSYQQISSNQRKLQNHCQEFSKRIQKAQNLSLYDQQMIERGEKAVVVLKNKKKQLQAFRESVRYLKKAATSIQQQRYSNAIKQLNLYRQTQPTGDTPLKKTTRIFNQKIKGHLIKLIDNFWEINKGKILDIGTHCYNKVQLSTHEKTNIYQAFFTRNSTIRNSLIRKSSIVDENKGQAPLRFLKKIKDEQILQKYILRINVQLNVLKQTRLLCKQMKQQQLFKDLINKQIRKVVSDIAKQTPCDNQNDLKKLLSNYIGFLLFRRQVIAFFNIQGQNKVVFGQMYLMIGQQAKSLMSRPQNISQIMNIKGMLDVFQKVLQIIDLDTKTPQFAIMLNQIFKIYCSFSLQQYQSILNQQINQDNLMCYKPQSQFDQKIIQQTFNLKPPKINQSYNFTRFVMYVLHIFNQYYDRMVAFVKDTELNKSQLHDQLSALFQRIVAVYGGLLVVKDQPLQIAQGEVNLHYCQLVFRHYSDELEIKHQYMRITQFGYKPKLQTVVVQLRRRIREIFQQKIAVIMSNYQQINSWLPDAPNSQPNPFIQWTMQYVKSSINQLRRTNNPAHQQVAYSLITYISQLYWQYFQLCKQYNLLTIYNLDLDLMFIYKQLNRFFPFYRDLADKFKGLSQFYALMLTNNVNDILDKQKRDIVYSHIDLQRIIPILKKYNKARNNGGGKIRELKKKDIENVVKRLEMER